MKLILFAQLAEALKTIEYLDARPDPASYRNVWSEGTIPTCYHFNKGIILIGSVGIHSAQMAVSRHINGAHEIWNIGFAGALKSGLPIGSLVEISTVGKHTLTPHNLDTRSLEILNETIPPFTLGNSGARLISSDFPIHDLDRRECLAKDWDLVDMEGYGVAYASNGFCKPCRMWKIVSDFASPGGRELIRQNKAKLAEEIAHFIKRAID